MEKTLVPVISLIPTSGLCYVSRWLRRGLPAIIRIGALFVVSIGIMGGTLGCASAPKVSNVQITVEASADVNPDARRRASPILVRIYALKATAAFEGADFFSIYEKEVATIGGDLVFKEEFLLRPAESKVLNLKLGAEVKALGLFAAFRDLERATWRSVRPIAAGQEVVTRLKITQRQIVVE